MHFIGLPSGRVDMSTVALRHHFDTMDWGVGRAVSIAAPADPAALAPSATARRWANDLRSVVGGVPRGRRVLAGWKHLQPDGPGRLDRRAADACRRALDGLLAAGHEPVLTLLHGDEPGWLDERGGWLARDSAFRFADYAAELGRLLGDRVSRWVTSADFGTPSLGERVAGMTVPGRGVGAAGLAAVHHVLLGHGLAVRALRDAGVSAEIGGTTLLAGGYPASDDPADRAAVDTAESWANRLFLDPLLLGRHLVTEDGRCPVGESGCVRPGDLELIAAPQDVLYLTWYAPVRVTTPQNLPLLLPAESCYRALNEVNGLLVRLGFALVPFDGVETGRYGWPVLPEALADALAGLAGWYGSRLPPVRIVDNGMGDASGGAPRRRAVLASRLGWLARLMERGVPVRGYEYWSIVDNLPWLRRYARLYSISDPAAPAENLEPGWTRAFARPQEAPREGRRLHIV
ncbi:beta-glucosidase [Amycolatopsis vastitatis]|uniref:Beta-glucosidase n=2 Tax=Amycolatopsis vastitatis TaxID=1905142 RepID=A0A229SZ25_9PSEU|nr:beta-glucosidase [Amycolatopsis vastitatis]